LQPNSTSIEAEVLWFNAAKGFGFVKLADGSDAFLHIRALEAAGHSAVSEGMRLTVRLGEGPKGPQVADVLEVGPQTMIKTAAPSSHPARSSAPIPSGAEQAGTVKWYNAEKGFGFVAIDGGVKDAFVHVSALKRSGLEVIQEGQRVVVEVGQGQKGPEVRALRLA
jgi:CspA family cold shock protein